MDPGRWQRVGELFESAREMPAQEREGFLARACAGDGDLQRLVESLIVHDREASRTVESAVASSLVAGRDWTGTRLGPWRLERRLGQGGMGEVWLAERVDAEFERRVAIKLMRGWPTADLERRFLTERRILALLDHPNIARLLDGGTQDGLPYVVMEYVQGLPIDAWCHGRQLGLERRLELFCSVCSAVDYAHRNLIVHRDIKPGNILVTADGVPKLLDFGVAKLLDPAAIPGAPARTGTAMHALTPRYASPEQVRGAAITTSTDVYSLGVLLYELLTGSSPYGAESDATPLELAEAIARRTPRPPSEAPAASSDLARARRRLRGDLDRIVLTALRKEPERRYGSVAALAADLRAFLDGRPVAARGDRLGYRARKLVARHPLASAAAAAFGVVVLAFTGATLRQSRTIVAERDRAVAAEAAALEEARAAKATADFLTGLFQAADPRRDGDRAMTAEDLLDAGIRRIAADRSLSPPVRAKLYLTLGLALCNLERYDAAIRSLEAAIAERDLFFGSDSLEAAETRHRLGDVLRQAGDLNRAQALLRSALATRRRLLPGDTHELADSLNNLALVEATRGEFLESRRLQEESIAMHSRLQGESGAAVGVPLYNLALLEHRRGKLGEALALARRALPILEATRDTLTVVQAQALIARAIADAGEPERAIPLIEAAIEDYRRLVGPESDRVARARLWLAEARHQAGRHAAAERDYRALLARATPTPTRALALAGLGRLRHGQGRLDDAESLLGEAAATLVELGGPRHYLLAPVLRSRAEVLIERGASGQAEQLLGEVLAQLPDPQQLPHIEAARALVALARIRRMTGRRAEARELIEGARRVVRATVGDAGGDAARIEREAGLVEGGGA